MMEVTVENVDLAPLAGKLAALEPRIREGAARGVSNLLRRHFRAKDQTANAKGFKRSHFWAAAAGSVTTDMDADAANVHVGKEGVRLRWLGGVVKPVKGKMLAIPNDGSVAGVWPSEHKGKSGAAKTFMAFPKGRSSGFIATKDKGREKGFRVLWWLVPQATHKPDPTVLPGEEEIREAAAKAARSVLRAAKTAGGGAA